MIRVFVLYSEQPDPGRYEQHVELARQQVPGAQIRHGPVLGGMLGPQVSKEFGTLLSNLARMAETT